MRERMVSRGLDQWDWYIVPAGALGHGFGSGNERWVDGVGVRKVCTLPMATLADEEVSGELWLN